MVKSESLLILPIINRKTPCQPMKHSTQSKQVKEVKINKVKQACNATTELLRPSADTLFLVRLMARVLSPAY